MQYQKQQPMKTAPISREEEVQREQWEEEDRQAKSQEAVLHRTQSFQDAMQKPVSSHVDKIDNTLNSLLKDLENSRKDLQYLKHEMGRLEQGGGNSNFDLSHGILNEVSRIEEEFRKIGRKDREELDFYGQQMKFLKQDRNKLDEAADILGLRVKDCENDVGFRFVYDF